MAPLLVVTALNLISIPLFYRYLGVQLYALWFYVLSLSGTFGFADLGLGVAVGRYVGVELGRGDLAAARSYWGTGNVVAIPLLILMSITFTLAGIIYGPRWFNVSSNHVPMLQLAFLAAGPGLFFSFYAQFWNILAQVHLDFRFISLVRVAISFTQVTGSILLAAITRNPPLLVAWASALSVVQLLLLIQHARRKYAFHFHWRLSRIARLKEMAGYTTKTFLTLLVNNVLSSIDRLVLGRLATPAEFASYTVSSNAGGRISGLSSAIMGPIFGQSSRAVGAGSKDLGRIYDESFDFLFGWLVLVSVWCIVWKSAILQVWLGPQLGAMVDPLLPPIIVAYCFTAISNISGAQLGPLNRVGTGLIIHVIAGLVVIVCVYLGWKWATVIGVAYGYLVSRIVLVAQDFYVMRLTHGVGWLSVQRWLHLIAQVFLGAVFVIAVQVFRPSVILQLLLSLMHGAGVALWLLRKDVPFWLGMIAKGRNTTK
jgi:O-antigen/teichoic acid export membrane protein